MSENTDSMLRGMDAMQALSLYSETDSDYRITWECGQAEAAELQRRAGCGDVTPNGYSRTVPHEWFANVAAGDSEAEVEEV